MPTYNFSYRRANTSEFAGTGFVIPEGQNEFTQRFWVRDASFDDSYTGWKLVPANVPVDVNVTFGWDYGNVNQPDIDLPILYEHATVEFFVKISLGENSPDSGSVTLLGEKTFLPA